MTKVMGNVEMASHFDGCQYRKLLTRHWRNFLRYETTVFGLGHRNAG